MFSEVDQARQSSETAVPDVLFFTNMFVLKHQSECLDLYAIV